ncbi:MAG: hypothetical protein U5O16_00955 [Rhodococcus sp. (in: high G+C Gram-positive bacteria)]|uniref:hypothetical protein n=1 Tax=Rhodococcus sp. TaxID=1831 RepID=UPI002AD687C2|nr:hypothetical protein [Rhodococcus sp. (in: high G+C Gram-positive bacteria)]
MTTSNIVRFELGDGRTVSTAAGSPLHREYLARLEAEAAETDSGVPVPEASDSEPGTTVGSDSTAEKSSEKIITTSGESDAASSESVASDTSPSGRGRKAAKPAAEKLDTDGDPTP